MSGELKAEIVKLTTALNRENNPEVERTLFQVSTRAYRVVDVRGAWPSGLASAAPNVHLLLPGIRAGFEIVQDITFDCAAVPLPF